MKLREKEAAARFLATDSVSRSSFEVDWRRELATWQYEEMSDETGHDPAVRAPHRALFASHARSGAEIAEDAEDSLLKSRASSSG
jgi:hypothetical protein